VSQQSVTALRSKNEEWGVSVVSDVFNVKGEDYNNPDSIRDDRAKYSALSQCVLQYVLQVL